MGIELLSNVSTPFLLGLLAPLGAICVLSLYPAFVACLSNQLSAKRESRRITTALFGLIMTSGVILFMSVLGLLFTTVLQVSLTRVIEVVSPIAFGILIVISLLLLVNIDVGRLLARIRVPMVRNPRGKGLINGFFFGAAENVHVRVGSGISDYFPAMLPISQAKILIPERICLFGCQFEKSFLQNKHAL